MSKPNEIGKEKIGMRLNRKDSRNRDLFWDFK